MSQVFLSYRHIPPDEELAQGLCAYLAERGLRVFLDKQIRIGLDWVAEIDRQLRASESFVVFLSEDSIRSEIETLRLDEPTDPPIEGDSKKLLETWQDRLALKSEEQMRPVPR